MTKESPRPYLRLLLIVIMVVGSLAVSLTEIQPANATTGCIVLSETKQY